MAEDYQSHIKYFFSKETLKMLFAHALMIDMESNNEKVDVIRELIGPKFSELGPGTNRVGMIGPDGFCYKIALDRRGIVDNMTEFKRSPNLRWCTPKAYECNGVILVVENIELISKDDFVENKANILRICEALSKTFIFEDIGFAVKNFCNWGIRTNGDLLILDTGYMIPRLGNEEAMRCPCCGANLRYNSLYTGFICSSGRCNTQFSFIDVYRRLDTTIDDELYESISGFELPDFDRIIDTLYNSRILKGGEDTNEANDDNADVVGETTDDVVRIEDILTIISDDGILP